MDQRQLDKQTAILSPLLGDLYYIDAVYPHENRLVVSLTTRYDRSRTLRLTHERLAMAGYEYSIKSGEEGPVLLTLNPKRRLRIPAVNLLLFFLTLFTVYFIPVFYQNSVSIPLRGWLDVFTVYFPIVLEFMVRDMREGAGIEFTIGIMSILFVHEMGHFIASRRRHIVTSWPYFIPAPNIIGTFGAIIKSKSPFWNRRDLIEVGAAGPIAGWVVALGWLVYGLSQSLVVPAPIAQHSFMGWSLHGESFLMQFLVPMLVGPAPAGYSYILTEAAFAGWVGLLVTAINMLPIGQLDGGHIVYGLIRGHQRMFGWIATAGLLALGFQSPMWWFFAAFGLVFGVAHPPTLDDERRPNRVAFWMGVIALIILVLSFTPVPFRSS